METKKKYATPTNVDLGQTSNWSKLVAAYLPVARPTILDRLVSRARPTLNLPCISPQNSVTCNGEYRRPVIKSQRSFHGVQVDGVYAEYLHKWCNLFYAQINIQTRTPFAVDPLKKMACLMSIYLETGRSANSR